MKSLQELTNQESPQMFDVVQSMAKEQLLFLIERYKMDPQEIIHLYTGEKPEHATYETALHAIIAHRTTAELWNWYN